MKHIQILLTSIAALLFAAGCSDKGHDHGHDHDLDHKGGHANEHGDHTHSHKKKTPGPNGGRILTSVEPNLEFLVMKDRKVQISALTADAKVTPVTTQTLTLTGGDRANPTSLTFAKSGDVLVSDKSLPDGKRFPVILQIKTSADSSPVTDKFEVNFADCPTCDYQEYACICDHSHPHD
jgi:hypothetical protein